MDRAVYIAMTGAKNNMFSQASHANNLANSSTYGFKSDYEQARAIPVWGEHHPSRAFAMTERPASDFNDGALVQTDNPLDVAIAGDGFFEVIDSNGQPAYNRRGDFSVTPLGEVINGSGQMVMGTGGPITLPEYERIEIAYDGVISIKPAGAASDQMVIVDQIKLVNPDLQNFEKGIDGLFRPVEGELILEADETLRVVSGYVEGSNVNPVAELTNMLAVNRQYETQIKMMKTADEMSESSASILPIS